MGIPAWAKEQSKQPHDRQSAQSETLHLLGGVVVGEFHKLSGSIHPYPFIFHLF
jgi:hypothetical protein